MPTPDIDFARIRPYGRPASRPSAFEELASILIRDGVVKWPVGTQFFRFGNPDGGREGKGVLPNGDVWAWQAKYLFEFDASAAGQVSSSISRVLEHEPNLKRYYVALPLDFPAGDTETRTSAYTRWTDKVAEWKESAQPVDEAVPMTHRGPLRGRKTSHPTSGRRCGRQPLALCHRELKGGRGRWIKSAARESDPSVVTFVFEEISEHDNNLRRPHPSPDISAIHARCPSRHAPSSPPRACYRLDESHIAPWAGPHLRPSRVPGFVAGYVRCELLTSGRPSHRLGGHANFGGLPVTVVVARSQRVARVPTIQGVIDRRVLVNFRIDPDCLEGVPPDRLRPQLVGGYAIGGICLIRVGRSARPGGPRSVVCVRRTLQHRIAVEWDEHGQVRTGVYIPRRDMSSRLNALVGGRLFPGEHRPAMFDCEETDNRVSIRMRSRDGTASITEIGGVTDGWPADSVFRDADDASAFFELGALGFSPRSGTADLDALELETVDWSVVPLAVEDVGSSFFGDRVRFPVGSATFDNALLMRDIDHRWHQRQPLCGCDDHAARPPDSTAGRQDIVPASR